MKLINRLTEHRYALGLICVLAINLLLSCGRAREGLPYLGNWDEIGTMVPVLYTLKTGDFNPLNSPVGDHMYDGYARWVLLLVSVAQFVRLAVLGALRGTADVIFFDKVHSAWPWFISHPSFYYCGRLVTAVLGTASVGAVYAIARRLAGARAALIAAFLTGILPVFVLYSSLTLPYIPLTLAVLLTTLFLLRYNETPTWTNLVPAGICLALAISMRVNCALLIIPATAVILWSRTRARFGRLGVLIVITVVGELLINYHQLISFPLYLNYLARLAREATYDPPPGMGGIPGFPQLKYYLSELAGWYQGLKFGGVPSWWFAAAALPVLLRKDKLKKNCIVWGTSLLLFLPMIGLKYHPLRGILFLAPFTALLIALGVSQVIGWLYGLLHRLTALPTIPRMKTAGRVANLVLAVLLFIGIVHPLPLIARLNAAVSGEGSSDSRTIALRWVAEHARPRDTVVVARELRVHDQDLRLIILNGIYRTVRSDRFRQLSKSDLADETDGRFLRALQNSPELVYRRPELVIRFLTTNKIPVPAPEVIVRDGGDITGEWLRESGFTGGYIVSYETLIKVKGKGKVLRTFSRPEDPPPLATFGNGPMYLWPFSRDPKVVIRPLSSVRSP